MRSVADTEYKQQILRTLLEAGRERRIDAVAPALLKRATGLKMQQVVLGTDGPVVQ